MPSILVVDDDRAIRHLVQRSFADTEFTVLQAENIRTALEVISRESPDVLLLDILLPDTSGLEAFERIQAIDARLPVIYMTANSTSETAIAAMKLGAYDYLMKPLDVAMVRQVTKQAASIRQLMKVPVKVGEVVSPADQGDHIVGKSPAMQDVFKAIGRVAAQNVTVLIRGESGTGKELVARAIYQHSLRCHAPFLAVNCAAIPEQLLESELFGHEKGSFTGADRQRIGKFEQCNHGTILLDEIGDMPAILQSKMLRLLQQQEFQRVGGSETIKTDVRILAATNRPLEALVAAGSFREDLLYRLNGYTIRVPPLRERMEDLIPLIQHILGRLAKEIHKNITGMSSESIEILQAHNWPGNIRELEGVLRQTLLQSTGTIISAEFLPASLRSQETPGEEQRFFTFDGPHETLSYDLSQFIESRIAAKSSQLYAETLEVMERYLLTRVLTMSEGNQSEAARLLGITRGSLRTKIRALGISIESRIESAGATEP
jgi:nitrogen regulation protein NR(I)